MKLSKIKKSYRNLMLLFSIMASIGLSGCGISKKNQQDSTKFIPVNTLLQTLEDPDLTVLDEMFDEKKCEDLNKVKRYLEYSEKLNSIAIKYLDVDKYKANDSVENYAYYYGQPDMYTKMRVDGTSFNNYNERVENFSEQDICNFIKLAEEKLELVNDLQTGYGPDDLKKVLIKNDIYLAIGACNDFLADEGRKIVIDSIDVLASSVVVDNTSVELKDLDDFEITVDDYSPMSGASPSDPKTKCGEVNMYSLLSKSIEDKNIYLDNAGSWDTTRYSYYSEYNNDMNDALSTISQEMSNHIDDINSNQNKAR